MKLLKTTFYIAFLALILVSCRSKKAATSESYTSQPSEWTTLYAPIDLNLHNPSKMSMSTRATMRNGEYIHLSMRFLGMEMATLYLNNDSIFFVDKYHKYLFAEPLADVLGQNYSTMTIGEIQNLFLGRTQITDNPNGQITPSNFVKTPVGLIASDLQVILDTDQGHIEGNVEWNPATAKWNEPNRSVSFKTPANYQRITQESLKSVIKSMSF